MYIAPRRFPRKRPRPFIIGITGSVGKTSGRTILTTVLQKYFPEKKIYTSPKNFNGELGLSLSILGIDSYTPSVFWVLKVLLVGTLRAFFGGKKYDIVVLEYGIDHEWEMNFLLSIAVPDIAILTKIDRVHSQQFGDMATIAREKYSLLSKAKRYAFFNGEDDFCDKYLKISPVKSFVYDARNAFVKSVEVGIASTQYEFQTDLIQSANVVRVGKMTIKLLTSLPKENIVYAALGLKMVELLSTFFGTKVPFKTQQKIELNFELQPSRFSRFSGIGNSILFDSTYNASPESMQKVCQNFFEIQTKLFPKYKPLLCLGDMRELGKYTQDAHENLAKLLATHAAEVLLVGESMKQFVLPKLPKAKHFPNSQALGEYLKTFLEKHEKYVILFKGSQNTIFLEEAVKAVLKEPKDAQKLCRQEKFWLKKKEAYFRESLEESAEKK